MKRGCLLVLLCLALLTSGFWEALGEGLTIEIEPFSADSPELFDPDETRAVAGAVEDEVFSDLLEDVVPEADTFELVEEAHTDPQPQEVSAASEKDFKIENGVLLKYNGYDDIVVVPDGVTKIGNRAFENCLRLTSITLPASVTTIGDRAFAYCQNLTSITINGNIEDKEMLSRNWSDAPAFWAAGQNTTSGITVTFGNGVTRVPSGLFLTDPNKEESEHLYPKVTRVFLPDSVTEIGRDAFRTCHDLKELHLGNNLRSIGSTAFADCSKLAELVLPGTLETIEDAAFLKCASLSSLTLPDSVKKVGNSAFERCAAMTSLKLSESLETLGLAAFLQCEGLTTLSLPASLKRVGVDAFGRCTNLASIAINGDFEIVANYEDTDFSTIGVSNFDSVFQYAGQNVPEGITVTFGNGVTRIPVLLFSMGMEVTYENVLPKLTKVIMSDSITEIDSYAFDYCFTLEEVQWSNGLLRIGERAFERCTGLRTLTLPASLETIGRNAFYYCTNLTSITVCGDIQQYNWHDDSNSDGITVGTVEQSCFEYAGRNTKEGIKVTFANGVTRIPDYMFCGYKDWENGEVFTSAKVTRVILTDTATEIGKGAFKNCYDLSDVDYAGSPSMWARIVIGRENECLTNATIHFGKADISVKPQPKKVRITQGKKATLIKGKKLQLKVKLTPNDAKSKLTWKSSNTKVATVSKKGVVKAKKPGTAKITVKTANGMKATIKIKVVKKGK